MKVEIKEKLLKAGNRSLYLEYYEPGFRKKESLGLYLIPDDAPNAKKINAETYAKAVEIQSERILNPPKFDEPKKALADKRAKTLTWLGWCDEYIAWSEDCDNCKKMLQHKSLVRKRIEEYLKKVKKTDLLLKDVTKEDVNGLLIICVSIAIVVKLKAMEENWPSTPYYYLSRQSKPSLTELCVRA